MIEDVCLKSPQVSQNNRKLLEFIRQIEISEQFYDPNTREILHIRNAKHVLTSHDVDYKLGTLAPYLTTLSIEPKDNGHLESIFEVFFLNFLNSLPNSENIGEINFTRNLSKVIRFSLTFLVTRIFDNNQTSYAILPKMFQLERSFWQIDPKHFITRTGIIGVFRCEFQRLIALSIPVKKKQEEFSKELLNKLRLNLNSSMSSSTEALGVVSRLHIPGTTSFVESRKEHIQKLTELIEDSPMFLKITLNDFMMNYVLELNRFLDSPRPVWLTGKTFVGKKNSSKVGVPSVINGAP